MKLTPENIEKIEAVLTMIEEGHFQRGIIIEHDLMGVTEFSNWLTIIRQLGIDVPKRPRGYGSLTRQESREFIEFLKARKKANNG